MKYIDIDKANLVIDGLKATVAQQATIIRDHVIAHDTITKEIEDAFNAFTKSVDLSEITGSEAELFNDLKAKITRAATLGLVDTAHMMKETPTDGTALAAAPSLSTPFSSDDVVVTIKGFGSDSDASVAATDTEVKPTIVTATSAKPVAVTTSTAVRANSNVNTNPSQIVEEKKTSST